MAREPSAATTKVVAYAGLTGAGLVASVVFQQPALAALAAPFAMVLVLGLASHRTPNLRIEVAVGADRLIEGDDLEVVVTVHTDRGAGRVEVLLVPQEHLVIAARSNPVAVDLSTARSATVTFLVHLERWGAFAVGDVVVRSRDRLGFFVREARFRGDRNVRVYPEPESLRRFARPQEVQVLAGNQTARSKADGVEFADLRPFVPGDRARDVNWRVTARRGSTWVNERHPDRNADVVLFVDVFAPDHLDDAVRAASMLVAPYLHGRDRVGLVSFGGTVRWLAPAGGVRQLYRMADALVESRIFETMAAKDIDLIPSRALPPRALVLVLTPLDDRRIVDAVSDLRRRGRDVAVVEIAPSLIHAGSSEVDALAWRLWQLERGSVRDRLRNLGVTVVEWPEELAVRHDPEPGADGTSGPELVRRRRVALDAVGEELRAHRRHSRRAG